MAHPEFMLREIKDLYDRLPPDKQEVFAWLYDNMRVETPVKMTIIHGAMIGEALNNHAATFWEVAARVKRQLGSAFYK